MTSDIFQSTLLRHCDVIEGRWRQRDVTEWRSRDR